MAIVIDEMSKSFRLDTPNNSYSMQVSKYNDLLHMYYGMKISDLDLSDLWGNYGREFSPNPWETMERTYSLDVCLQELPGNLTGDYRTPGVVVKSGGTQAVRFQYKDYKVYSGKEDIPALPSAFASEEEADTLEITLEDAFLNVQARLYYTVFRNKDIITRFVRFENCGQAPIYLEKTSSLCVEFPDSRYELITLPGAWAMERIPQRHCLCRGRQVYESRRGVSSHQMNPFFALVRPDTNEKIGVAYGAALIYSGNFQIEAEVSQYDTLRLIMGIHPQDFTWKLEVGEVFYTPEAVMTCSQNGLGGMSRNFHDFYRENLCNPRWKERKRPILINNWEATYFDFNKEKLLEIGRTARKLGIELLVMDDGWFGNREDDTSSLGDWIVNRRKLPEGLEDFVKDVKSLGLEAGIWMEPEMVSENSDLYRRHPEWCLQIAGRPRSSGRSQYVLDLSREDVCEYLFQSVDNVLSEAGFTYLKWDMNRHLTEVGSSCWEEERQGEIFHRYVLGLYRVLERITDAHPDVLIEGCAGGGGRFDFGILYYCPQIWTSDDTDAGERLLIQYGTSLVYPPSVMGSHVSACPNHQTGRIISLKTRGMVATAGVLGYEMDLGKLTDVEKDMVTQQVCQYKKVAQIIFQGDYYRLENPEEGKDYCAWSFVSKDKNQVLVSYVQIRARANGPLKRICLEGLDAEKKYRDTASGSVYQGDTLMYVGLSLPVMKEDFAGGQLCFESITQ